MLYCSYQHYPCLHLRLHHHHHRYRGGNLNSTVSSSLQDEQYHQTPQNPTTTTHDILRTHNFKSTSLLLHHQPNQLQNLIPQQQQHHHLPNVISPQEMSHLTSKPIPRFPGSLTITSYEDCNEEENDDVEKIMRAVEIRRKVTVDVFKEAMKKGKFGITYSTNLVSRLDDFIDFVMIEAVAMKRLPEFESSSFNVRASTVIQDLNVVPLVRWLKHNAVSYPKIAKLICLSRGDLESIRRLAEWLKSVHVKGDFLGSVLTKAGDNILERSNEELDGIVLYLENNGVRRDWMGYVISRCPQLLSFSVEEVKTRVGFYLDMGMNKNDFGTMVFDYPGALGCFSLEEMSEKVNYLKEFGLNNEDVGRLLAFKPQLMACSIEKRWKPLIKYLYYLGISRDGMKRMLIVKPMVFCFELETTIVPKVRFFQDIGIRDEAIGNMLVKFPPLLTYSLYKKIRPVVIFLMTKAGVTERDIGKVIAFGPELLGCSIANKLEINLKYYLSLGIHLRLLGEMITDFPMLLRYNIEILRPKYQYLRRTMVRPLRDLIEFPRFFSYSLDGRIIPRHKVLLENRINFKLRYMLACTDEEFEKKVEAAVERRRKFESCITDDSLSNSQLADDPSEEEIGADFPQTEIDFPDSPITDPSIGMTKLDSFGGGDSAYLSIL